VDNLMVTVIFFLWSVTMARNIDIATYKNLEITLWK